MQPLDLTRADAKDTVGDAVLHVAHRTINWQVEFDHSPAGSLDQNTHEREVVASAIHDADAGTSAAASGTAGGSFDCSSDGKVSSSS